MRWVAMMLFAFACVSIFGCSSIVIDSEPAGAKVYIDGRDSGLTTPAKLIAGDYSRGLHQVTVKLDGYLPETEGFEVRRSVVAIVFSIIPPTGIVALPLNFFKHRWSKFDQQVSKLYLNSIKERQRLLREEKETTARMAKEAARMESLASTFFGLTIDGLFSQEFKKKLGKPTKKQPYDENVMWYYDSAQAFAPFHQMLVEHSPSDSKVKSLRFYGFYDSDEKAAKHLKALRSTLERDFTLNRVQGDFFYQDEPNTRIYRIILTKFKPKKDQDLIVIDNNRLKIYHRNAGANKTLLVLDVLGYSYKVDKATIDATSKGIRGELKPIDKKQEELKEGVKTGKRL